MVSYSKQGYMCTVSTSAESIMATVSLAGTVQPTGPNPTENGFSASKSVLPGLGAEVPDKIN